ncbi:MAG: nitroreductase family protein [Candidatus Omnitrophica bacterium]|nr:nitroreductase family protein [Candidatus Omnitrophota bacterium]
MNFIDLVKKRQSTRSYTPQPVSRDVIDRCIEAARLAPSACNSQPWTFIVIDDPSRKNKVGDAAFSGMYSMSSFAQSAPVLIIVITEKSSYAATLGTWLKGTQFNLIDIGIAGEHLVLQATEEGLGTCLIGWFNEKAVKKELKLPSKSHIDIIISMGYPQDAGPREKLRKPIDAIRSYYKN